MWQGGVDDYWPFLELLGLDSKPTQLKKSASGSSASERRERAAGSTLICEWT